MIDYLSIEGGAQLRGTVTVSGAKNAALPLLMASLVTAKPCILTNVPDLEDISVTFKLLRSLGAQLEFANGRVKVQTPELVSTEAPYGLVKSMRASFWVLGPLVARAGSARVALPGGDAIGTRPVDLHLKGLARLGAEIRMDHGVVSATAPGGLNGGTVELNYPSVGATHHLLITAALIPGETIIEGAAQEPEIVNVAQFLRSMGVVVEGAGSTRIVIRGASELGSGEVRVIGDRVEAATYLLAGAMSQGTVTVRGIAGDAMGSMLELLTEAGCSVTSGDDEIVVAADSRLKAFSFTTSPFPGVATDLQPLLMAALTTADGISSIVETVFENRFGHVAEFRRLGAKIRVEGNRAVITGTNKLSAAPVEAGDIRAAAGLILMGLSAEGTTELFEIHHLDRGYEALVEKFRSLGARMKRIPHHEHKEIIIGC